MKIPSALASLPAKALLGLSLLATLPLGCTLADESARTEDDKAVAAGEASKTAATPDGKDAKKDAPSNQVAQDGAAAEPELAEEEEDVASAAQPGSAPAPAAEVDRERAATGRRKILLGEGADPLAGLDGGKGGGGEAAKDSKKGAEEAKPKPEEPADEDEARIRARDPASLFEHYGVGPTIATAENAFSTFAVDVDTASYAMTRAYIERGEMPPEAAVRVEEVVNYFDYHYAPPEEGDFSLHAEVVPSPQRKGYHVLHLGVKGKEVKAEARPDANLVFVIDVSGSMRGTRLSTVKQSLSMLIDQLDDRDSIGIVAYGSSARVVLEPTSASQRGKIQTAIDTLKTEGSTNLQAGLELGYDLIGKARVGAGINRVVLCSDGVANTGATTAETILASVAKHAKRGITISTVGVGMGGYNDVLMEKLADKGNGNYAYVDDLDEAQRVFVEHLTGTLQVIAKDVKLQVEFDPKVVSRYRLIGYENRGLTKRDFDDDKKDAGEIGAGHTVTALYEIKITDEEAESLGSLRVRYKAPRGSRSELLERPLPTTLIRSAYDEAAPPTRLSMVAAAYAEKLRGSYWVRNLSWAQVQTMYDSVPESLKSEDEVAELGRLIAKAARIDSRSDKFESDLPVARMDFDRVPVLR